MKLVSFAVVSFLAATVSAGVSATLGNADYNVHRLEKRGPGEDMQKQLKEEIRQDWEHYRTNLETYQDMERCKEKREAAERSCGIMMNAKPLLTHVKVWSGDLVWQSKENGSTQYQVSW
ncbi:hypothetical protein BASA83_002288 [Batrachochytrium salamandrivorans]|nr:hypothetical protein BASA83_002288 [Batrachochytrium salamandrivorans]